MCQVSHEGGGVTSVCDDLAEADFEEAIEHIADECAINPLYHYFRTSLMVPECPPVPADLPDDDKALFPDASYILSLPPQVQSQVTSQTHS